MTADAMSHPARSWTTVLDGARLRELRREHGFSQAELAGRAGISLTTIVRLEREPRAVCRGRTLARLATALQELPAAFGPQPAAASAQTPAQP